MRRAAARLGRRLGGRRVAATGGAGPRSPTSLEQFARRAAGEASANRLATLDVGPQSGRYGRYFKPARYEALTIQASSPATTPRQVYGPRFAFDELPVDDEQFDLVLCAGVVERARAPSGVLRELNRVLVPRGKLFLASPLIVPPRAGGQPARLPRYGLNYLLEAAGFAIEDLQQLTQHQPARAYAIVARKTRRPGHQS